MEKYIEKEKLDLLHIKLLEIMKIVHEICVKNHVNYYLIGGTLLGAVRHKGFIPWDDDIDIGVPRNDYEKIINILNNNLPDNLKVLHYSNSEKVYVHFAKVIDLNNYIIEETGENQFKKNNVFIDIFPLDNVPDNKIKKKIFKLDVYIHSFKIRLARIKNLKELETNNSFKKIIFRIIKFLKLDEKFVFYDELKNFDNCISKYKNVETKEISNVMGGNGILIEVFNKEKFLKQKEYDFENLKLLSTENYDMVLTQTYGDYMKLPPKEKQVCKHILDIEFKDAKEE